MVWSHRKRLTTADTPSRMRPQFARDQVSDLDLEEAHIQDMMQALDVSDKADGWTEQVDIQVLFFRLTLDAATQFLFGQSVGSQIALIPGKENLTKLDSDDILSIDFATSFDVSQMALATRGRFADKYWLVNPKGFRSACRDCHKFIDHYVQLALSKDIREKELEEGGEGKKKYVFLEALAEQTRDPIELRTQLLNILLAGRDTTASLLGWLFLSLSKDPARYKKLRNVIIEEFGTYDNPSEISYAKLKSSKYLQYCINESLRLYPVVPINSRYANKDTFIPLGGGVDGQSKIFIPKGSAVDYSVHVMHHRKDIWGEDAEDFNPERWEGKKVGWEYLPVSTIRFRDYHILVEFNSTSQTTEFNAKHVGNSSTEALASALVRTLQLSKPASLL